MFDPKSIPLVSINVQRITLPCPPLLTRADVMNLPCTLQGRHGMCAPQNNPGLFQGNSNGSRQFGRGLAGQSWCPELMSGCQGWGQARRQLS